MGAFVKPKALAGRGQFPQIRCVDALQGTGIEGKAVITGASGFVGGRLRTALLAEGVDVVALTRAGSPPVKEGRAAEVDYGDVATLRAVFEREKPDYVFHVAGATKGVTYEDFHAANVVPTQHLMQALREVHRELRRFCYVSSLTAYGPSNEGPPLTETDTPQPVEHYGRSKLEAERAVEAFGDSLPWTIVRPAGVYGPGDVDYFELFKAAARGVNLFFGNRDKRASMIYVDDLVRAMVEASLSDAALGRGYFVCDDVPRTWQQLQAAIVSHAGRRTVEVNLPSFLVKVAAVAGEAMTAVDKKPRLFNQQKATMDAQQAWLCVSDAARQDFDFVPRVDLDDGVRRTFDWYRQQGWL